MSFSSRLHSVTSTELICRAADDDSSIFRCPGAVPCSPEASEAAWRPSEAEEKRCL